MATFAFEEAAFSFATEQSWMPRFYITRMPHSAQNNSQGCIQNVSVLTADTILPSSSPVIRQSVKERNQKRETTVAQCGETHPSSLSSIISIVPFADWPVSVPEILQQYP